jgi:hypothetical protein
MISRAEFVAHARAHDDDEKAHGRHDVGGMKDGMKDDAGGARPRAPHDGPSWHGRHGGPPHGPEA